MLDELSKKDKLWKSVAFAHTKNRDSANELVQEMYIKMIDSKLDINNLNDNYFKVTLYNLFKDTKKDTFKTTYIDDYNKPIVTKTNNFSYNDEELWMVNKLSEDDKSLMMMSYDKSVRNMEKYFECSYVTIYRRLIKIRKRLLKNGYETEYRNRRLKHKR